MFKGQKFLGLTLVWSGVVASLSFAASIAQAESTSIPFGRCDGLTVVVHFIDFQTSSQGRCVPLWAFAQDLAMLDSLQVTTKITGCVVQDRIEEKSVLVSLYPEFARSSGMDAFDLGKRLWSMKESYPAMTSIEVCRD